MPWFLHCWAPDPEETQVADASLRGVTPTRAYVERKGRHLTPQVRAYLQALLERPFSFYEVEVVEPGHGMTLRDVLTGEQHAVFEATASKSLGAHDPIFGQLVETDGVGLLEAVSPVALPIDEKVYLVELRQRMTDGRERGGLQESRIDDAALREWEPELRELYLDLCTSALYSVGPQLTTPEGDPLEFHKLIYDIDSPQRALDACAKFAVMANGPIAMKRAIERDSNGGGCSATLDLARPGQDPGAQSISLLGTVRIEPHRLTVDVNSRERAQWVRANLIPAALGTAAAPALDQVQTVDQLQAQRRRLPRKMPGSRPNDPESSGLVVDALRSHYQKWIDTPLPVLHGCTPRAAAASGDGREQVAALLNSAEQIDTGVSAGARKQIFDSIRGQLTCAREPSDVYQGGGTVHKTGALLRLSLRAQSTRCCWSSPLFVQGGQPARAWMGDHRRR